MVVDIPQRINEWDRVCRQYLPVSYDESIWRFSRIQTADEPDQGWKLHVSATIHSATRILERIGPFLTSSGVLFKGPKTMEELARLNTGKFYGYTQIGKCFTIYPKAPQDFVRLANQLHELTTDFDAPVIPFDRRFKTKSCVFYRYGSFKRMRMHDDNGVEMPALQCPSGELVPDSRLSVGDEHDWVTDPFGKSDSSDLLAKPDSLLKTRFQVFKALSQRGKGGVYWAVDISGPKPKLCVLKEGRKHGEIAWDGRDGYWRIQEEAKVLQEVQCLKIDAPCFYGTFYEGANVYLAKEFIPGVSLEKLLSSRKRRLKISHVIKYSVQLALILSRLHAARWIWRDCKPSNLIVSQRGKLRPIDFESASRTGEHDPVQLGTLTYLPEDFAIEMAQPAHPATDLYAMGVVIYYLLTGVFPSSAQGENAMEHRKHIPSSILNILSGLLHSDPSKRPSARLVAKKLAGSLPKV